MTTTFTTAGAPWTTTCTVARPSSGRVFWNPTTVESRRKRHIAELQPLGADRQQDPPDSGSGGALPECCVLDFEYPVEHSTYFWRYMVPTDPAGAYRAGWHFKAWAFYSDIKPGCECTCCQFSQYVVPLELRLKGKDRKLRPYSNDPAGIEDCLWFDEHDVVNGRVPLEKLHKVLEDEPPLGNPHIKYICYGRDNGIGAEHIHSYYHTQCIFEMCDEPSFLWTASVDPIESVKVYVGQIYDTCRHKLKRREIIRLSLELTSSGASGTWRHQTSDGDPASPDQGGKAHDRPNRDGCA